MNNRLSIIMTVAICTLVFSAVSYAQEDIAATTLVKVGDNLPEFTLKALSGGTLSSAELKGKVVLINFWATWCPPCRAELPRLQKEIFEDIQDANLVVLAISRGEKEQTVKKFIGDKNYTFPVYLDSDSKVYNLFASRYIPRNFVLGKDGKIVWATAGFERKEFAEMITIIRRELSR